MTNSKRSWRCIGLTLLMFCPGYLFRKEFIRPKRKHGFSAISRSSKSSTEQNRPRGEVVWGNRRYKEKMSQNRNDFDQLESANQESRQDNAMLSRQKALLEDKNSRTKNRQIQTSPMMTNHPSQQSIKTSLLSNPSVANLLESWGVNPRLEPAKAPQILDPTISDLVASWGSHTQIPVQSPPYPSSDIKAPSWPWNVQSTQPVTTSSEQLEQGPTPTSQLSYSSVDDILESWFKWADETPSTATSVGSDRKKGTGKETYSPKSFGKEKAGKGSKIKGQKHAPVSAFPSPSVSTILPTSINVGKGKGGMGNMMKGQTDAPTSAFPSPSVSTILPTSINLGKGKGGMGNMMKEKTDAPTSAFPSPSVSTILPTSISVGGMGNMMKGKTDAPTSAFPPPPVSAAPSHSKSKKSKSKENGMKGMSKDPKTETPIPPAPVIPPLSTPNTFPVATPIQPVPIIPPLSTPITTPATVPSLPAPLIQPITTPIAGPSPPAPISTPITSPATPSVPTPPTTKSPINPPAVTPNSIPVSTPIASPVAPIPTAPTMMVPNVAPATNAPMLTPVSPPAPITGTPVNAAPFQILYEPTPGPVTPTSFAPAMDITCAHVEQSIMAALSMGPFIIINDISCRSVNTTTAPTTITFETTVVFDPMSILPPASDIDRLIMVAFEPPQENTLLDNLNMLPSDNPFSSTTSTTYSIAAAPIRQKDFLLAQGEVITITGSYAFGITAFVGFIILLTLVAIIIRRKRKNRYHMISATSPKNSSHPTAWSREKASRHNEPGLDGMSG